MAITLPDARQLSDEVLEHLVGLGRALPEDADTARRGRAADRARIANLELRHEQRERGNYFGEIEKIARESLAAVGYPGSGPVSERVLTDLAAHFGFTVENVVATVRKVLSSHRKSS